jgi:hypothetical protein
MHSISFFSRFVFGEFIAKGGEYMHKVGRALTNRVVERRNMINIYLNGESMHEECWGEFVSGVVFEFVSLSSSLLFLHFAAFHVIYWFAAFPSSR